MKPFQNYPEFNVEFERRYGQVRDRYGYAFVLVELILRMRQAERFQSANNMLTRTLLKSILSLVLTPLNYWKLSRLNVNNKRIWVGRLRRFAHLQKGLKEAASAKGINFVQSPKRFEQLFSRHYLDLNYFSLGSITILVFYIWIKLRGVEATIRSPMLMIAANSAVRKKIQLMGTICRDRNFVCALDCDDQSPDRRIMAAGFIRAKRPFFTLAHGYFGDGYAITVFPVYSSCLFFWSESQKRYGEDVYEDTEKLAVFGFPLTDVLSYKRSIVARGAIRILIVAPVLSSSERHDVLSMLVAKLESFGSTFDIALHPKDRSNCRRVFERSGNKVLDGDLDVRTISSYELILGGPSTSLYMAHCLAVSVCQIIDFGGFWIEPVKCISLRQINNHSDLSDLGRTCQANERLLPSIRDRCDECFFRS